MIKIENAAATNQNPNATLYKYDCLHSLCNAHHLRELEWSASEDKQEWAAKLKEFLEKLNKEVTNAGGKLTTKQSVYHRKRYKDLLVDVENMELARQKLWKFYLEVSCQDLFRKKTNCLILQIATS